MTAKQADWKIINLGGQPTELALERYGVPLDEVRSFMHWYNSKRSFKFKRFVNRKTKDRKPCIMYGFNTAHR